MWKCRHFSPLFKEANILRGVARLAPLINHQKEQRSHINMPPIDILPEVRMALDRHRPVVALESTIITHGMPFPQNLQTAGEVEALVRENGATPATIAIIKGRIKLGLNKEDLYKLAATPQSEIIKCSRRDLPFVVAYGCNGGTTVAATMIIAHANGIRIFATGGIGGVHRNGHVTMDVSADLVELGRTPVAVISSGVKSILDIPRTLEYLETLGVCVATYGEANGRFPDFYTSDSGCVVPYNFRSPKDAARLIASLHSLNFQSGVLIGVPIPVEFAADKATIEKAIDQAHVEADKAGVCGKELTPFLLKAITTITDGNSLQANIALIKNNATVAAQIARELYGEYSHAIVRDRSITKSNKTGQLVNQNTQIASAPLVIGASILDVSLTMMDDMPTTLDGATYRTSAKQSAGGVGRNLAEGIFKLNNNGHFISAVGDDEFGRSLLQLTPEPLRAGIGVDAHSATSLCSVILDQQGDCKLVLGNMDIHQNITPRAILAHRKLFDEAPLIIMDANLSVITMKWILLLAQRHNKPVLFEPTDMRIAAKPFQLSRNLTKQIKLVTPNLPELISIVRALKTMPFLIRAEDVKKVLSSEASTEYVVQWTKKIVLSLVTEFDCILVTMGHRGVLLMLHTPLDQVLYDVNSGEYVSQSSTATYSLNFFPAPDVKNIRNVSGAGDSFASGFSAGLLRGYDARSCIAMGFIAAEQALHSDGAVPLHYFNNKEEESQKLNEAKSTLCHIAI